MKRSLKSTMAAVVLGSSIIIGASIEPISQVIAKALRPRPKMLPSEWGAIHRRMKDSPTGERFDLDFFPWIRPIIDLFHQEPHIEGWFFMKPSQVGGSQIAITLLLYLIDYAPGPILYVTSTQEQAKKFSESITFAAKGNDHIAALFNVDGRQTQTSIPFAGGTFHLTGSGSESAVISNPCRYAVIDEWDRCNDFPTLGSAPKVIEKRLGAYRHRVRTGFFGFAHPTTPDRGIAMAIETRADLREWTIPCPHCSVGIVPEWEQVHIVDRKPESATWYCPHCSAAINDAERSEATRRGSFVSVNPEHRGRAFVGLHLSRLCDPLTTLYELAREYCECVTESDYRVFMNMQMGRPFRDLSMVLTDEGIEAKAESAERSGSRTVPANTKLITIGVDVQYPKDNPTMFVRADGWTTDGNAFVIEFLKIAGWSALAKYVATFEAHKPDGSAMRPRGVGVDSGFLTDQVYTFCRSRPGAIECVPMKYDGNVDQDAPVVQKKISDPSRPELGKMLRVELARGYWMGRQAGRWKPDADPKIGGSVIAPASIRSNTPESVEFRNHIKANSRAMIVDENGHEKEIWTKEKGNRDDWFQAGVFAEVVAYAHGLDRWYAEEAPATPAVGTTEFERGLKRKTSRGRPGRSKFGRRKRRGRTRDW